MALKVEVSETARARVAADFNWLPKDAQEIAGGWLTLIEQVDARYTAPPPSNGLAIEDVRRSGPEYEARVRREWAAERELVARGLVDLLNLYPKPIIITTDDAVRRGLRLPEV